MLLRCRKRRSDASLALAPAAKIDSQGTHQGAPPFPVVHQEGLHERGKGARSAERANSSRKGVGRCSVGESLRIGHWRGDPNRGEDLVLKRPESWDRLGGERVETSRADMFRKLLERDPENPMVLYSLGSELFKEKKYSEAREHLGRAVRNKPDYSVAYRTLGRTLYELGEDHEARRVFSEGREVAQRNGDLQTVKEIDVFTRRLEKRGRGEADSVG